MRVRVLIGLAVGVVALAMPTTAEATSCEGTTPSDVVLTGTAVSVRNHTKGGPTGTGTWARLAVDDVWRNWSGSEIPPIVELRTATDYDGRRVVFGGGNSASFEVGTRYLVGAQFSTGEWYESAPNGVLVFSGCGGAAEEWTPAAASQRPATAKAVADPAPTDAQPWPSKPMSPPYLVIAVFMVVVIGGALLYRRSRRRSHDQPSVGVPT